MTEEQQQAFKHVAASNGSDVPTGTDQQQQQTLCDSQPDLVPGSSSEVFDPLTPVSTESDNDVITVLQWKDGVGVLPGTDMKFRLNENKEFEMVFDNCDDEVDSCDVTDGGHSRTGELESTANPSFCPTESGSITLKTERNSHQEEFAANTSEKIHVDYASVDDQATGYRRQNGFENSSDTAMITAGMGIHPAAGAPPSGQMITCDFCSKTGHARAFCGRFCSRKCVGRHAAKRRMEGARALQSAKKCGRKRKSLSAIHARRTSRDLFPGKFIKKSRSQGALLGNENLEDSGSNLNSYPPVSNQHRDEFQWETYLASTGAEAVATEVFKSLSTADPFPTYAHEFEEKSLLEAVDPQNQSIFSLVSIAATRGFRLQLHFEGYSAAYDFWVNADSPFIFPCGFCSATGRNLAPPYGYKNATFNLQEYASLNSFQIAPDGAFRSRCYENKSGFELNDRLEAIDRQNPELTCVATVTDAIDRYVLIHFDGWDHAFDYWCLNTSNFIRPTGWCHDNEKNLSPPLGYTENPSFAWDKYLTANNYKHADPSLFACQAHGFKTGLKLEVVDPRNPMLVRVATIVSIDEYKVKVHFDGWTDAYDVWIDSDSRDLHPITWCSKTGEELFVPSQLDQGNPKESHCPVPGCHGIGHVRSDRFSSHYTAFGCPYSPQNLYREPLQDRLTSSLAPPDGDNFLVNGAQQTTSDFLPKKRGRLRSSLRGSPGRRRRSSSTRGRSHFDFISPHAIVPRLRGRTSSVKNADNVSLNIDAAFTAFTEAEQRHGFSESWKRHVLELPGVKGKTAREVSQWTTQQVSAFVSQLTGKEDYGDIFVAQEIDGEAFLMLTQSDISSVLQLKLGPSVKIFNAIVVIKRS